MFNKRGISGVITTVLMILLIMAAIGILWFVLGPYIRSSLGEVPTGANCISIGLEILSAENVFVDTNSDGVPDNANLPIAMIPDESNLNVRIKRTGTNNDDLSGIKFYLNDEANTEELVLTGSLPKLGETKSFTIHLLEKIDYNYLGETGDIPTYIIEAIPILGDKPCPTASASKEITSIVG